MTLDLNSSYRTPGTLTHSLDLTVDYGVEESKKLTFVSFFNSVEPFSATVDSKSHLEQTPSLGTDGVRVIKDQKVTLVSFFNRVEPFSATVVSQD